MHEQSALGQKNINRKPLYDQLRMAKVTSVKDFSTFGRVSVVFLDYSQPVPVWCFGSIDREPVEGDTVMVGFIEGRKDTPYLHSFYKNESYGTNFVVVTRNKVKLQLPIFDIGVKDGVSHKDVQGHLLDDTKQAQRAYVELTPTHAYVSFPTSKDGSTAPATIEITADGMKLYHPKSVVIQGATQTTTVS
jgi:hypothetical protein